MLGIVCLWAQVAGASPIDPPIAGQNSDASTVVGTTAVVLAVLVLWVLAWRRLTRSAPLGAGQPAATAGGWRTIIAPSVRLQDARPSRLHSDGGVLIPPSIFLFAGVSAWLAQSLGALGALKLAGIQIGGPTTLRTLAIGQAGAYAASLAVISLVAGVLPGIPRAIGAYHGDGRRWHRFKQVVGPATAWSLFAFPLLYIVGVISLWAARTAASITKATPPEEMAHSTLKTLSDAGTADPWWWATVASVVVGAPLIEECIYRGFLQTGLLRMTRRTWLSIIGTSLPFALAHAGTVGPQALPTLFVLSVALGLAFERTGRLWVPILMHAAFNLGNILAVQP